MRLMHNSHLQTWRGFDNDVASSSKQVRLPPGGVVRAGRDWWRIIGSRGA